MAKNKIIKSHLKENIYTEYYISFYKQKTGRIKPNFLKLPKKLRDSFFK